MNNINEKMWFHDIDSVIDVPLRFKAKLAIGEDAYTSLRLKNKVVEFWDALGVATTAAAIAKSSTIATAFFAPSGLLAALGIGTAVTPIGWVIAAGVVTGGAWMGVTRYVKKNTSSRIIVIPDFINTPMDVLALALFDLIAPLTLKVASVDGEINESEKTYIKNSFINEWGYNDKFVNEGLSYIQTNLEEFSITNLARSLAEFKKGNPDCNYKEMSKEIIHFLREVVEIDGKLDEREEMAVERVERIFHDVNKIHIKMKIKTGLQKIKKTFARSAKQAVPDK